MKTKAVSSHEDLLDVRDIIERYEELEEIVPPADEDAGDLHEERGELAELRQLLDDLCGNGGDHEWKGDWYPVTLIRDSYFTEYAQELAEDIGAIDHNASWPAQHIDWEAAAEALQADYSTVEFEGVTYWYR